MFWETNFLFSGAFLLNRKLILHTIWKIAVFVWDERNNNLFNQKESKKLLDLNDKNLVLVLSVSWTRVQSF